LSKFQLIEIVVLFLRASSSSQLQRDHFSNLLRVYLLSPSENTQYFCQLIAFLSNVAHHYRHELGGYEQKVLSLLEERNASLDPKLRLTLIKAVIQMRVHDVLLPHATLPLFFRLLGTQDKTVREVVQKHIMTDLRGINTGRRNEKTNKLLQNFLFTLLRESDEMTSACATEVVVHLYNQHIWTGAKTVNVLATAALSPISPRWRRARCASSSLTTRRPTRPRRSAPRRSRSSASATTTLTASTTTTARRRATASPSSRRACS
jgi:hypothetical protein